LAEKFARTPIGEHFADSESWNWLKWYSLLVATDPRARITL